jgi:hypothetical protein
VVDFRIGEPPCIECDEDPKTVFNVNEIKFDNDYQGGGHSDLKTTLIGLRKTISQFKLLMNQLGGTLCANETSIAVKDATNHSLIEETIIFSNESESSSYANSSLSLDESLRTTEANVTVTAQSIATIYDMARSQQLTDYCPVLQVTDVKNPGAYLCHTYFSDGDNFIMGLVQKPDTAMKVDCLTTNFSSFATLRPFWNGRRVFGTSKMSQKVFKSSSLFRFRRFC